MRDANAVEWSDIDVYVLFKDAFVSEGEAAQAEQLGLSCAPLTPLRLDLHAESEQSQDSLPGFLSSAVTLTDVTADAIQPSCEALRSVEIGKAPPCLQECFLHDVFGFI